MFLRIHVSDKKHELRVYDDRFIWSADGAPALSLVSEVEMMRVLEQELHR